MMAVEIRRNDRGEKGREHAQRDATGETEILIVDHRSALQWIPLAPQYREAPNCYRTNERLDSRGFQYLDGSCAARYRRRARFSQPLLLGQGRPARYRRAIHRGRVTIRLVSWEPVNWLCPSDQRLRHIRLSRRRVYSSRVPRPPARRLADRDRDGTPRLAGAAALVPGHARRPRTLCEVWFHGAGCASYPTSMTGVRVVGPLRRPTRAEVLA